MLEHLAAAFGNLFAPWPMLFLTIGTAVGIVVGAIPGLTATMLISLTLPLTFYMHSVDALTLLIGMYVGGISGGLIAASQLRMPGTPASIMTTFDGFPMAQKGQPERALALGIMASVFGGIVSWMFLAALSPPLARIALQFGPFEYFAMVMMALVMLAALSQGSLVKGLLAGCLGMLFAMPGIDDSTGRVRLTFGWDQLDGGLSLLPVLIGAFAFSQILKDIVDIDRKLIRVPVRRVQLSLHDFRSQVPNMLRSSVIGTWIGLLPGIGGNIAAMVSYSTARSVSRTPEKFGTGHDHGVVSAETANNASVGGALIPLITMGIPGSVTEAILIGALIIHNLQPGPLLFQTHPEVGYGIISAYLIANILMLMMLLAAVGWIARMMYVPRSFLLSAILLFCVIGTFALSNRFFDAWVMLAFGLVGFALEYCRVPLGPFVIGFVLSPIAERELRSGLMSTDGSWMPLIERPFALSFLLIAALTLVWPLYTDYRQRRAASAVSPTPPAT